jgi:hypothetical protein
VPVTLRSYRSKRAGLLGTGAPARAQYAAPCSTTPLASWSFRNDHMIEWPMGTGGNPFG